MLVNSTAEPQPDGVGEMPRLDIEVFHALSVGLDESFAGQDLITHEHTEGRVCGYGVFCLYSEEGSGSGVHSRLP
jgi:hypothetical protein